MFFLKVYETICQSYMDEGTEQGYSTRQISFCVNHGKGQDFHSVFVHEKIRVSFEIEDQQQQNFVTPDDARRREFVSSLEAQKFIHSSLRLYPKSLLNFSQFNFLITFNLNIVYYIDGKFLLDTPTH